ncbi:MAG: hypothetical protein D6812_15450 [Deltaproteobacteria bacterium]|nr:MAG: hypothetical protein D6812_15450 [Deltaproteobacteria bacterium]
MKSLPRWAGDERIWPETPAGESDWMKHRIAKYPKFSFFPILVFLVGVAPPSIEPVSRHGFFEAEVRIDPATLHLAGNRDASVILLEFSDYRCPSCMKFNMTVLPHLRQTFIDPGKIAYAFVDAPLSTTDRGILLPRAAFCAAKQGHFWDFHDWLFLHPTHAGIEAVQAAAKAVSLDLPALETCLSSEESKRIVLASQETAQRLGVSATPAFFVGWRKSENLYAGKWVRGAEHYFVYRYLIEKALRAVEGSAH